MNKRIALFHTEFYYSGGAEKLIFHQIDELQKKGLSIDCFTGYKNEKKCFPELIGQYSIYQILPQYCNKFISHDMMIILTTICMPFLVFRWRTYDVYLGENQAGHLWAYFVSLFFKKHFFIYQSYPMTLIRPRDIDASARRTTLPVALLITILKPVILFIDRKATLAADAVFANGRYTSRIMSEVYKRNVINCPGGSEKGIFTKEVFEKRYSKNPYMLITNRHMKDKKFEWGINALHELRIKMQNRKMNLVITGEKTAYTEYIEQLAKEQNVFDSIVCTGLVSESELHKLYANALVYLYTAPEEDFGLGIVEAMAHGVPVVAWNKAGPAGIIENGKTGYLISPENFHQWEEKIHVLIKNKKHNWDISNAAYKAAEKFTWEKHGEIIYRGMMKMYEK